MLTKMLGYLSILSGKSLCLDDLVCSFRYGFNQGLNSFLWNFFPFFPNNDLQVSNSPWRGVSWTDCLLQNHPQILFWVEVRTLCWPLKAFYHLVNSYPSVCIICQQLVARNAFAKIDAFCTSNTFLNSDEWISFITGHATPCQYWCPSSLGCAKSTSRQPSFSWLAPHEYSSIISTDFNFGLVCKDNFLPTGHYFILHFPSTFHSRLLICGPYLGLFTCQSSIISQWIQSSSCCSFTRWRLDHLTPLFGQISCWCSPVLLH